MHVRDRPGARTLSMKDSRDLTTSTGSESITENGDRKLRRLELAFWLLAIGLGFFHAWADHHYLMNSDAMSYLDIAEAYLRRDWAAAVNTYWNPLYSWLIAFALLIVKPSPYWKFAVLHVVNYVIYLFALGCFGFFIRELVRRNQKESAELLALPDWALLSLGYSLFIWSSLFLVSISVESPDMLVAAFMYLATGVLLRLRRKPSSWLYSLLFGVVLGFGYLAKSVMLPIALLFIVASLFARGSWRRALPRVAVTVACFLLVAGPFVVAMSQAKGRLTTGEAGKLNYLWSINRIPNPHWQGEEAGSGQPKHPTRKIFDTPPTFEFGQPVKGTYPVWYDPTYWYEGSVSHFDLRQQLRVVVEGIRGYYELFHIWGLQYGLLVALVSFYVIGRRGRLLVNDLTQQWCLIIPALAGMGLYLLVNVQGRYVASFLVLLWLALFSAVRLRHTPNTEGFVRVITLAVVASIVLTCLASSSREVISTVRNLARGEDPLAHEQWQIAEGLREKGMTSSDRVATVGDSRRAFWAHLLGLRIIAEVRRDKAASFWQADSNVKHEVINAFTRTGAKAIVAEKPPPGTDLSGWQQIRQTDYYVYMLSN
jgi:hypothetical protein